jgi:PAS domain S-box-containing protein
VPRKNTEPSAGPSARRRAPGHAPGSQPKADDGISSDRANPPRKVASRVQPGVAPSSGQDPIETLVANLPDASYMKDAEGRILAANPAMARLMGAPDVASLLGRTDFDFYPREIALQFRRSEEALLRSGRPLLNIDEPRPGPDGATQRILTTKVPLRDDAGRIIGLVGISRDITDRGHAEEEIKQREEQYRSLFQNMQEGFAHCLMLYEDGRPADFLYLEVNKAFKEITGLEDVVGKRAREIVPDLTWSGAALFEVYARVARTGKPEKLDFFHRGLRKWLALSVYCPASDHFVTVVEDRTEARQTEQARRESERSFRSLFENATLGLYRTTPEGRILMANPALLEMLGYESFEELAERNLEEQGYEPGYDRAQFKSRIERSGVVRGLESAWKRRDGSTILVRESARLVRDEGGKSLYFEGVVEDVTERLEVEQSLAAEQNLLRTIVESLPDNVFIKDVRGRIILDNSAHRKLLGRATQEEVRGKTDRDFFPAELADSYERDEHRILETGQPLLNREEQTVDPQGRRRWLLTTKVPVRDPGGAFRGIVGINTDITEKKEAEEALRRNEMKFRTIFDSSNDAIFILGPDDHFIEVNLAACERLGYAREDLLALSPVAIDTPEHAARARDRIEQARRMGSALFETEMVARDGRVIPTEISARVIEFEGQPALLSLARDITERRHAQESLRASEERFRLAFEEGTIGMALVDREGTFFKVNPAFCRMLGYTEEEMQRLSFMDITHPEHRAVDLKNVEDLWAGRIAQYSTKKRYLTKSGDVRWGSLSVSRLQGIESGRKLTLAMIEDITEQKRAEQELEQLASRQEAILAAVPDIIMEVDNRKVYTWANQAGYEFFGRGVIGKEVALYFEGDQDTYARVEPLLSGDVDLFYVESWQRRRDGERRLLGWWCKTLRDPEGRVTGALSSARDITPQKQAEIALRQSEQKYRDLVENINDVIYTTTLEGLILYVSPAVERVLGYSPQELIGQKLLSFVAPEDRPDVREAFADVLRDRLYPSDYRLRKKDQTLCWVRTSSRRVESEAGGPALISGVLVDLTDRKKAEEELRVSEEKFRYIFDNSPVGKSISLPSGEISVNRAFCEMLGYEADELSPRTWQEITHPEDVAASQERVDELLSGKAQSFRFVKRYLRKDGNVVWADVSTSLRRDGQGQPLYFMTTVLDISERKRAEEELERHRRHLEELVQERTADLTRTHQQMERILRSAGEGIFGLNAEGRIIFINEAGAGLLGYSPEELVSRKVHQTFHASQGSPEEDCPVLKPLRTRKPHSEINETFVAKDGRRLSVEFNSAPIGGDGVEAGAVVVFRDVTDRKRAEEERRKHMEELERFNRAMIDREKRIIEIKEEVNRLCQELGREPKYPPVWK